MSKITDFLPQIQQVNVLYRKFAEQADFDCKEFRTVVDFYYAHRDVGQFEKMILDVLLEKEKDTTTVLLKSLRSELDKNIEIYDSYDAFFDGIEADEIADNVNTCDLELEALIKESSKYAEELFSVTDMIDRKAAMPEGVDHHNIWERYEAILDKHKGVTVAIYELYKKREGRKVEAAKYDINPFADICDLCEHFNAIIDKYLPNEIKTVTPAVAPTASSSGYFDMGLVSAIHKLCNGEQFESVSELELYAILNNHPTMATLKIKSGEKTRVCHLIHRLSEQIKGAEKVTWRGDMLRKLEISESYYSSKYREPVSEIPSQKSEQFAKELKSILG